MPALLPDLTPVATQFDEAVTHEAERQPLVADGVITESDLAPLPPLVATYLRRVGVVGRPRVHNMVVEMDAQLNRGRGEPWMETPILQVSFVDHPTRLFLLRTRMHGLPVSGLHAYTDEGARMQIRLLGYFNLVNESGDAFTRAETVTVLNDFCVMAPAVLVDRRFTWETLSDTTVRVAFHNGPRVVHATLTFDADGDLVDFASDDRHARDGDGFRWTTPLREYRDFGVARLASEGDAIWHYRDAEPWLYGRMRIKSVRYNVPAEELPHADTLR